MSTYEEFINLFLEKKSNYDSFNSVSEVKEFLILDQKPINFNFNQAPNSQNLRCYKIKFCDKYNIDQFNVKEKIFNW